MHSAALLTLLPFALAAPAKRSSPAPLIRPRDAHLVEGKYIVKMKSGVLAAAVSTAVASIQAEADLTYSHAFQGFTATLSEAELKNLQDDDNVEYIEQDAVITVQATQEDATWGLARISHSKTGSTTYVYDQSAGSGTCAYIVDTGIEVDHKDFEGRAKFLKNFADDDDTDGNGHGTHVAGTIGSATYGIAKKTSLFAVKVLDSDGQGKTSGVLAGMDFVVGDAQTQNCPKGVVVNMSLGGYKSDAVNQGAAKIVDAGLFLAVAAGNGASDASGVSPASEPSACTVGATTRNDTLAPYSNFGKLVDVLAPGSDITSTWIGGGVKTISGTSMASPHIAGLGAYMLGLGEQVSGLCECIAAKAIKGVISGVGTDTANLLANNGNL